MIKFLHAITSSEAWPFFLFTGITLALIAMAIFAIGLLMGATLI